MKALRKVILHAIVYVIVGLDLLPVYFMLNLSLSSNGSVLTYPPKLIALPAEFANYVQIWVDPTRPLLYWLRNSAIVAGGTAALCLIVAIPAAYTLSRFRFRGKRLYSYWLLAAQLLPFPLVLITLYMIMLQLNLLDTLVSVILADTAFVLPFSIWMMKGFFDTVPVELEEAALTDGADRLNVIVRITLRLMIPGLAVTALYAFVNTWGDILAPVTLLRSNTNMVASVGILMLQEQTKIVWNTLMASALVVSAPIVVLFVLLQKYFVKGITAGAVKG